MSTVYIYEFMSVLANLDPLIRNDTLFLSSRIHFK